jgi:hypothetical protein
MAGRPAGSRWSRGRRVTGKWRDVVPRRQDGVVWQRDLGETTEQAAAAIQSFDPDSLWTPIPAEE